MTILSRKRRHTRRVRQRIAILVQQGCASEFSANRAGTCGGCLGRRYEKMARMFQVINATQQKFLYQHMSEKMVQVRNTYFRRHQRINATAPQLFLIKHDISLSKLAVLYTLSIETIGAHCALKWPFFCKQKCKVCKTSLPRYVEAALMVLLWREIL